MNKKSTTFIKIANILFFSEALSMYLAALD